MSDVTITSAAEHDYTEALRWYAERSLRAAEGFEIEFEAALASIGSDPHRYPYCDARHQFCLMRRYPFQSIYREQGDEVFIIAVAHARRTPKFWSDR